MNISTRPPATTISSRRFNQNRSAAKKLAEQGPVIITDRGRPTHVLMTHEEYQRISSRPMSLLEALAQPGGDEYDFDFDIPKLEGPLFKPAEFDIDFED
ncbi:MAG: type II toxin-antitoxin system Phd/YefM family antitoxin [Bauldia sp.]|nr:type II toxin-antitoxin system Phd/YefM family antitoxin [Bauldia sp.]